MTRASWQSMSRKRQPCLTCRNVGIVEAAGDVQRAVERESNMSIFN
jgi:hypothetical protein